MRKKKKGVSTQKTLKISKKLSPKTSETVNGLSQHKFPDLCNRGSTSPVLVTLLQGTRSIYLHVPILISYEHRLAFAQDDLIRHTLLSMITIIAAVLRADTSRTALFIVSVTTAAAVSTILVFAMKLVRHRFHLIILPARSSDLCSDTSI